MDDEPATPDERILTQKHLAFYLSLADGSRPPTTPAQQHFVAAVGGRLPATTKHEIAFLKWKRDDENRRSKPQARAWNRVLEDLEASYTAHFPVCRACAGDGGGYANQCMTCGGSGFIEK
jgi:uncharacterized protein YifE (UPF0438 family)